MIIKRIYHRLKSIILNYYNSDIAKSTMISNKSKLFGIKKISIGRNSVIHDYSYILANGDNDKCVKIGDNCIIHEFSYLKAFDGSIQIGDNCTVNSFVLMYGCVGGIKIGNGVRIATGCSMVANSHVFEDPTIFICNQGVTSKGIIIDDDVWLGSGVRVIDGVKIGKGAVIGANAVVTHDIPEYAVAVGVPARVIKYRK